MRLPTLLSSDKLTIYLNDHLAGSTVGLELARRALGENRGTEFETVLNELAGEIAEDRDELGSILDLLAIPRDRFKVAAGWIGEKLGRVKLNGQRTGYSPLSRLLELEGLSAGVRAKRDLWRALREIAPGEPRLDQDRLERLIARADSQLERLATVQARAAVLAIG